MAPQRSRRTPRSSAVLRRRIAALLVTVGVLVLVALLLGAGGRSRTGTAGSRPGTGRSPRSAKASSRTGTNGQTARPGGGRVSRPRPTRYRVGIAQATYLEPSAAANANSHTASGAPVRVLATTIRYPAAGPVSAPPAAGLAPARSTGRFPLIVFSQGFDYSAEAYSNLLDAWARAGYVVADPTYPHTAPGSPDGVDENDILNHPRDLRYVISSLLSWRASQAGSRVRLIDPTAVAVVGQSDGGDVSLAVAAGTCCRDPRVKAAAILSGAELPALRTRYYAAGAPPLLVIQGDQDTINAPGCSAALYDQARAPKYYLDLIGAPHLSPYVDPNAWRVRVAAAVRAFLDYYLKHDPGALARLHRTGNHAGVSGLTTAPTLAGRTTYCPPTGIR